MTGLIVSQRNVGEISSAVFHFHAVSQFLDKQDVAGAETYLDGVLERQGQRVHDAVLSMIAAAREVPPTY